MKCHERWIDLLASVNKAYPELSEEVQKLTADCQARVAGSVVDFELIEDALNKLYELSVDSAFGWKVGWNICLRTQLHRTITVYTDLQATMGDALMVTQKYPELLVMPGMKYVPKPTLTTIRIQVVSTGYNFRYFGQIAMMCMAAILKAGRDTTAEFDLTELIIAPEFLDQSLFSLYTKADIRSETGRFSMGAKLSWLKFPKPTADAMLAQSIKPILDKEVLKLRREESLLDQIENALYRTEHPQKFTLKAFSIEVGRSEASIRRNLSEMKVSFSDLLQNFLRTTAIELLMDENETVDSITFRLGFSERAAFERAFKRWYGLSAIQFRQKFSSMMELENSSHSSLAELELAPLPKVVQQALYFMDSAEYSVAGLAAIIKQDLVFSARFMSTANSAFYGAGKVRDLDDAIGRVLGLNRVRNMALSLAVKDIFSELDCEFDMQRLWFVSMFIEQWLERLRPKLNWTFELSYNEFVSALQFGLVGQLLIAKSDLAQKTQWLQQLQGTLLSDIVRWEKSRLGMSVFTISALLLARWGMSSHICKFLMSISPHANEDADDLSLPSAALRMVNIVWSNYLEVELDQADFESLACSLKLDSKLISDAYEQVLQGKPELQALLKTMF